MPTRIACSARRSRRRGQCLRDEWWEEAKGRQLTDGIGGVQRIWLSSIFKTARMPGIGKVDGEARAGLQVRGYPSPWLPGDDIYGQSAIARETADFQHKNHLSTPPHSQEMRHAGTTAHTTIFGRNQGTESGDEVMKRARPLVKRSRQFKARTVLSERLDMRTGRQVGGGYGERE